MLAGIITELWEKMKTCFGPVTYQKTIKHPGLLLQKTIRNIQDSSLLKSVNFFLKKKSAPFYIFDWF